MIVHGLQVIKEDSRFYGKKQEKQDNIFKIFLFIKSFIRDVLVLIVGSILMTSLSVDVYPREANSEKHSALSGP